MSREQLAFSFDAPDAPTPYTLTCADVLTWAQGYTGPKLHACLCDPPYHLISDTRNGSPRNPGTGPYGRHTGSTKGKGFMGKDWDGGDLAFRPDTWKALAQHLLPGAFIMAFASSRGFHRVMTAMEDAGLRLYPAIFGWLSGQSFPKATRIDAVLEKQRHDDIRPVCRFLRAAMERVSMTSEAIATHFGFHPRMVDHWAARDTDSQPSVATWDQWLQLKALLQFNNDMDAEVWRLNGRKGQPGETWAQREVIGKGEAGLGKGHPAHDGGYKADYDLTAPATPLAQTWAGHRYGGQMLKNSLEPIIVAQVPYQGKPVSSIVKTGAGSLNIDGARIQTADGQPAWDYPNGAGGHRFKFDSAVNGDGSKTAPVSGRWPPNFALSHTPQCIPVGTRQVKRGHGPAQQSGSLGYHGSENVSSWYDYADANGQETVAAWECAPGCVVKALDDQAGESRSGHLPRSSHGNSIWHNASALTVDEPNNGYDDHGGPSRFFHVSDWSLDVAEQLAQADPVRYCPKASRGERDSGLNGQRNVHPTVKPALTLCKWLATLLLPPDAYAPRRLLVPFAGTGSEAIGALLAGWDEIVLVEQDATYVDLAERRLAYWKERTHV